MPRSMAAGFPRFSVAPMMAWTDRHCRYFHRLISRHALLYTEMVTTGAVLHGDRDRLLGQDQECHSVALQLGGVSAEELAECSRIGEGFGYAEINLNVGCPSGRVSAGRFGACLMAEPDTVARAVESMRQAVSVPVTVKSRIAVDDQEEWPTLRRFAEIVRAAGADRIIVHARKALLKGLSPKDNREIPPLRYELVHRLKTEMPEFPVIINGGIAGIKDAAEHIAPGFHAAGNLVPKSLAAVDGVMLGRAAYRDPYLLSMVDSRFYGVPDAPLSRNEIVGRMIDYIDRECTDGGLCAKAVLRHMAGLYKGMPGAARWRRCLGEASGEIPDGIAQIVEHGDGAVGRSVRSGAVSGEAMPVKAGVGAGVGAGAGA